MKGYCKDYKRVAGCVQRILKWTGYKVRVKREAGFECPWDKHYPYDHFRYRVSIAAPSGESTWFHFWGSLAEYHENGTTTTGEMIAMWIREADYGDQDFEDFCADLGESSDSISVLKMYRTVVRTKKTVDRVFPKRVREALMHCAYEM